MSNIKILTDSAVQAWKQQIGRFDEMLAASSDADLERQVAPDRNRIFYLIGHLVAVHDRMLPLLRLGDRRHPELDQEFLTEADRHAPGSVSAATLRDAWADVHGTLTAAIAALEPEGWLEKHNTVSDEDFAKDPIRNRLSVLLSRTGHAAFHFGQIKLVK